jgi:hypothetical protein
LYPKAKAETGQTLHLSEAALLPQAPGTHVHLSGQPDPIVTPQVGVQPANPVPAAVPAARPAAGPAAASQGTPDSAQQAASQRVLDHVIGALAQPLNDLRTQVRWLPGPRRASLGVRWGIALQSGSKGGATTAGAIEHATGQAGKQLLAGLNDRIAHGRFDTWSQLADPALRQLVVVGGQSRTELAKSARQQGLDVLLLLQVHLPTTRGGAATLGAKIVDVSTGAADVSLPTLTSSDDQGRVEREAAANAWADELLAKIDSAYALDDLPSLTVEDIQPRLDSLAKKKASSPQVILTEIRAYQALELITASAATELLTKSFGTAGKALATADGDKFRAAALQAAKAK